MAESPVFNDMVAQLAHFAWGALLVMVLAARVRLTWAVLIVFMISLGKEIIESTWSLWEPVQSWTAGFKDIMFWCLGIAAGCLLWHFWEHM